MPAKGQNHASGHRMEDRWISVADAMRVFRQRTGIPLGEVRKLLRQDSRTFWQAEFDLMLGRRGPILPAMAVVHELARSSRGYRHLPKPHWEHEDDVARVAMPGSNRRKAIGIVRTILEMLRDLAAACAPSAHAGGTVAGTMKPRARLLAGLLADIHGYPELALSLLAGARRTAAMLEDLVADPLPVATKSRERRGPRLGAFGDLCWWVGKTLAAARPGEQGLLDSKPNVEVVALYLLGTDLVPAIERRRGHPAANLDRLARNVMKALSRRLA